MRAATLISTVGLLLLLLATIAASRYVEDNYNYGGGLNAEEQLMKDYLQKVEGRYEEMDEEFEDEFSEERGEQPSESYLQEVREQDAEYLRPIIHADTIALKYGRNQWLGCAQKYCRRESCPRLVMDAGDWTKCWGEVFRIYRQGSNDPWDKINVGDNVAIYYVRGEKWFGCANKYCQGQGTCPGKPGPNGAGIPDIKFQQCWGAVYTIYAYGKAVGEPITENDYIMLYYPRDQDYISLFTNQPYAHHEKCPGTARPPGNGRYDNCVGEALQIIKQ